MFLTFKEAVCCLIILLMYPQASSLQRKLVLLFLQVYFMLSGVKINPETKLCDEIFQTPAAENFNSMQNTAINSFY